MFDVLAAVGLVVLVLFLILAVSGRERKPGRKRPKGLAGAIGIFNELYHPSAANASVVVEEQKKARKQAGNTDKKKPQSK
ncbi:MAG: hypothetical protein RLZ53_384 [Actinomycetota bacterium]|jgi:hypothetical protein